MGKFDLFRKLNTINGSTSQEVIVNNIEKEFDQYIKNTPNSYISTRYNDVSNVEIKCTLQDAGFNDKKNGDEKILCTYLSCDLKQGDIIKIESKIYLITFQEDNTIKTHNTYIVRPCNSQLKFKYNGVIYSIPAIITNQSPYLVGVADGKYFDVGNVKLSCSLGINLLNKDVVKVIFRGMRFILYSNGVRIAYKITSTDTISKEGLLALVLEESNDLKIEDVGDVAFNNYETNTELETPVIPTPTYKIVSSTGDVNYLFNGSVRTFKVVSADGTTITDNSFTFTLGQSSTNPAMTPIMLITLIDNKTTLAVRLTPHVTNKGYFLLIATDSLGNITSRELRVKGNYDI